MTTHFYATQISIKIFIKFADASFSTLDVVLLQNNEEGIIWLFCTSLELKQKERKTIQLQRRIV